MNITEIMSDPRYQKAIRKRMSVDPRVKAVTDISDVVGVAGKEVAETELYGKTRADQLAISGGQLGIGEGKLGLREEQLGLGEKELGLGEKRLALKGEELSIDKEKTADALELKKQQLKDEIELKNRDLEYLTELKNVEKSQGMKAIGLSVLDLGLKGVGSYYNIKEVEKQDVLIRNEMKKREEQKTIANNFLINLKNNYGYSIPGF